MISVDGDMSTNDACYAFAKPSKGATPGFRDALTAVCRDLAVAMVRDGEGATKTLVLNVTGARDETQARTIARAVINSSLVKTALYGEDPNWGRVIAAAGAARAGLDPETGSCFLGGQSWVERGAIEALSEAEAHLLLEETDDRDPPRPRARRRERDRLGLRSEQRLRPHQRALPDLTPAVSRQRSPERRARIARCRFPIRNVRVKVSMTMTTSINNGPRLVTRHPHLLANYARAEINFVRGEGVVSVR